LTFQYKYNVQQNGIIAGMDSGCIFRSKVDNNFVYDLRGFGCTYWVPSVENIVCGAQFDIPGLTFGSFLGNQLYDEGLPGSRGSLVAPDDQTDESYNASTLNMSGTVKNNGWNNVTIKCTSDEVYRAWINGKLAWTYKELFIDGKRNREAGFIGFQSHWSLPDFAAPLSFFDGPGVYFRNILVKELPDDNAVQNLKIGNYTVAVNNQGDLTVSETVL
jgi:hypothetical protein